MLDMILLKDHVFSLLQTPQLLLTGVAKFGKVGFAKNAHHIGSSTMLESAFQYQTPAALTTLPAVNV
jgi:hypothetical protein